MSTVWVVNRDGNYVRILKERSVRFDGSVDDALVHFASVQDDLDMANLKLAEFKAEIDRLQKELSAEQSRR